MLCSAYKARREHSPTSLLEKISHPPYYRQAIERLHKKLASQSAARLYEIQPEGYNFAQAFFDKERLSVILAQTVSAGEYGFSPARLNDIVIAGKTRTVCAFRLLDHIVHAAVYHMLAEDLQPRVSPHVYSYVKGRDKQQALAALADFVRAHRKAHRRVQDRGLFVLRCDIKSYGKSIPVFPSSALWEQAWSSFRKHYGRDPWHNEMKLITELVRPVLAEADGSHYTRLYGIPDGASISAWLLNLYASPIDHELSAIAGGFYARYGDDMIFAHSEPAVFAHAEKRLDEILSILELARSPAKTQRLFFNAAARPAENYKGTAHVEFLGLRLAFNGTLSLKKEKTRLLLRDLGIRAAATAQATSSLSEEARGQAVCRVLNDALDPQASRAHPYAGMLRYMVNDRDYLRQIDYQIARMVVRAATGDPGVRGFRRISYRTIRDGWKLRSLEYARNS